MILWDIILDVIDNQNFADRLNRMMLIYPNNLKIKDQVNEIIRFDNKSQEISTIYVIGTPLEQNI